MRRLCEKSGNGATTRAPVGANNGLAQRASARIGDWQSELFGCKCLGVKVLVLFF